MITPYEKVDKLNVTFGEVARQYPNIDPGFALACFNWETGNGKSALWLTQFNPAGIMCDYAYCTYQNEKDGYKALFELLEVYTNGTDDYIGKRQTVNEVYSLWSDADDSHMLAIMWQEVLNL